MKVQMLKNHGRTATGVWLKAGEVYDLDAKTATYVLNKKKAEPVVEKPADKRETRKAAPKKAVTKD